MPISTANMNKSQNLPMLTRLYTNQQEAICMGIKNFLSLEESCHLLSYSRGADSREYCPRDYSSLPSFFCLPSLSFSPFSHFTTGTANRNGVSSSTVTTSLPDANPSVFTSGVEPRHQPTCLPNNICMESTTTEGALVAEGLSEEANRALETQEKTTEAEAHSPLATVYACTVSR